MLVDEFLKEPDMKKLIEMKLEAFERSANDKHDDIINRLDVINAALMSNMQVIDTLVPGYQSLFTEHLDEIVMQSRAIRLDAERKARLTDIDNER